MAANPDKSPKEIAEELVAQGFQVNAQYVSTIKSNANRKAGGGKVVMRKKPGRPAGGIRSAAGGTGMSTMDAALALITAAGGLEGAKATLATIEQIRQAF